MTQNTSDFPAPYGQDASGPEKNLAADEASFGNDEKKGITPPYAQDAFGEEEFAEVKYKTLKWWYATNFSN